MASKGGSNLKTFNKYKISEHEGLTVELYLKQILKISGRKIQKLTRQRGVLLNGKAVFLQKKLKSGDVLGVLNSEDTDFGVNPEPGNIELLYEDEYMLVLNKPPYQLVHPCGQTNSGTLANFLAFHLKQQNKVTTIRAVHRLDRDTSGCVIFAKDGGSQNLLEQQLKAGILKRTYWALAKGIIDPPIGVIDAPIGSHPNRPNRRAVNEKGEHAVTHYQTIRRSTDSSVLELTLETGRTHQIRVHLAYIGHPIIGDNMYGSRSQWINRQALHASSISFCNLKDGREIIVDAPLPADIIDALNRCLPQE